MVTICFGPTRLLRWVFTSMEPSCLIFNDNVYKFDAILDRRSDAKKLSLPFPMAFSHRLPLPWLSTLYVKSLSC